MTAPSSSSVPKVNAAGVTGVILRHSSWFTRHGPSSKVGEVHSGSAHLFAADWRIRQEGVTTPAALTALVTFLCWLEVSGPLAL